MSSFKKYDLLNLILLTPFVEIPIALDADIYIPRCYFILLFSALLLCWGIAFIKVQPVLRIQLNLLDIILLIFLIHLTFQIIDTPNSDSFHQEYIMFLGSYAFFLTQKFCLSNSTDRIIVVFILILLVAAAEAVLGMWQLFDCVSNNTTFTNKITGSFTNPSPYSNFLAIISPISLACALHLQIEKKLNFILKHVSLIAFFLIVLILPFTGERTAWITTFITSGFVIKTYFDSKYKAIIGQKCYKKWMMALLIIGILLAPGLFFLIYNYKPKSVDGRILIYKTELKMIKANPVYGVGPGKFSINYNRYQSEYLKTQPNSKELYLASNVRVGFNEYLQIWIENGLIGLICFLMAIYVGLKIKSPSGFGCLDVAIKGAILSILLCSLSSYPFRDLPTNCILLTIAAIISSGLKPGIIKFKIGRPLNLVAGTVSVLLGLFLFYSNSLDLYSRWKWKEAVDNIKVSDYKNAFLIYRQIYPNLNHDGYFLFNYGSELNTIDDKQSINILNNAARYICNSDLYINLADSYFNLNDFKNAEINYKYSSELEPGKFYPRYKLFNLYKTTGKISNAYVTAMEITKLKIKIPSGQVDEIRDEVAKWLKTLPMEKR